MRHLQYMNNLAEKEKQAMALSDTKDLVTSPEHYNTAGIETSHALEAMLTNGLEY